MFKVGLKEKMFLNTGVCLPIFNSQHNRNGFRNSTQCSVVHTDVALLTTYSVLHYRLYNECRYTRTYEFSHIGPTCML